MKFNLKTYNKISTLVDIKIEPFDVTKRYTKPHKHNKYLELVFFNKGNGYHYLDSKALEINAPIVFLIQKDKVHHWSINTIPEGYVIIIKESFLDKILDTSLRVQLNKLNNIEKIDIDPKNKTLPLLFKALTIEMKEQNIDREVIESGLKAILAKLITYSNYNVINKSHTLEQKFTQLLSESLKNNVGYYAEKLNTTPQNLNIICRKSFNKKASDVIGEFIIKEVKRQLLYTTKNITDIAYELDFSDTSNFTKFFKRHTNLTPLKFKKTNQL